MAEMTVGPDADGSAIDVAVGTVLTLRLPENRTSGFRWSLESPANAVVIDDRYEVGAAGIDPEDRPGGPGVRVLSFRLDTVGFSEFRLVTTRRWQQPATIGRAFGLRVHVVGGPGEKGV